MNVKTHGSHLHSCVRELANFVFPAWDSGSKFFFAASSYLSSWCSGTPAAVGRAAGEDEAGCSVRGQRSAAPGGCCCLSCSRSCKGIGQHLGILADPDPHRWRDSRWSRPSDGQYCEGPQGSPYCNRERAEGVVSIWWLQVCCIKPPLLTLCRYFC